ncbi:hypothetical protein B0T10DRAFT_298029 [Thelonectria olida]|uniref:Uncharacterized protein n=1 Tax=Thelonectria olida TaxID=1576542 RepID=A0A9P9AQ78_9HYPO|nr:hypothetical protein B0T10DRAFT_298029 [Thelonectria olida]
MTLKRGCSPSLFLALIRTIHTMNGDPREKAPSTSWLINDETVAEVFFWWWQRHQLYWTRTTIPRSFTCWKYHFQSLINIIRLSLLGVLGSNLQP